MSLLVHRVNVLPKIDLHQRYIEGRKSNQACILRIWGFWVSFSKDFMAHNGFLSCHFGSVSYDLETVIFCVVVTVTHEQALYKIALSYDIILSKIKRDLFFSLFCSVEKPSYAHSDQLLHCEPVLCWYPGHHYLPSRQSRSGHHRNMVLRRDTLSDFTLFTG